MQIVTDMADYRTRTKSAVAIGKFDGIHMGHKTLLDKILRQKEKGLQTVVFTFDPPPHVFFGKAGMKELTTRQEKRDVFEKMGIDTLIEFPLTRETSQVSAMDFLKEILVARLGMAYIGAGADLSFGRGGAGDSSLLFQYAKEYNYRVEIIEKVMIGGKEVSSSYIREEVQAGNIRQANQLLGREYAMTGQVVHGKKLGRKMGVPTVNLAIPADKLLPANGVYYSQVKVGNSVYPGITNIGVNPSVESAGAMHVETFLYQFSGDLYEREIGVVLLDFKRPEMKFERIELLQEQLAKDITEGLQYHQQV